MDRLTYKSPSIDFAVPTKFSLEPLIELDDTWDGVQSVVDKLAAFEDTGLTPERCAELAKAEQEGLLHIAPCADGTEIFYYMMAHEVPEFTCKAKYLRDNMYLCKTSYLHGLTEYEYGELGKGWFLTRQDAEKALEGEK